MLRDAGRLVAALLLGVPAGAAIYLLLACIAHPTLGALMIAHPFVAAPALFGAATLAGAVWAAGAVAGIDLAAQATWLHACMVASAAMIHVAAEDRS